MLKKSIRGFTLVELLLSMVFGLIVLAGVSYIYVAVIVSTSETLKATKLNTQLMTMMSIISNDIRRAGYWHNPSALSASQNPFNVEDETLLTIFSNATTAVKENTNTNGYCILYTYDKDSDGIVDDGAVGNEHFGFRFKRSSGSVQMAMNIDALDHDDCASTTWETLSDTDLITITSLSFTPSESTCVNTSEPDGIDSPVTAPDDPDPTDDDGEKNCYVVAPIETVGGVVGHTTVETREVLITLAGELKNDSDFKAKITQSIRVRNDVVRVR